MLTAAAVVLLASLGATSPDANRQGFALYEQGKIAQAHKLFQRAVKSDAMNAFAWLNLARTTTLLAKDREPDDPCAFEQSWIFLALAYLDRAAELDAAAALPKIDADTQGLASLKKREDFAAWRLAVRGVPRGDSELAAYLREHGSFWAASGVIEMLTLAPDGQATFGVPGAQQPLGPWRVRGGVVEIGPEGKPARRYVPKVDSWFFAEGKLSRRRLVLEQSGTTSGPDLLEYGPMMDCGG